MPLGTFSGGVEQHYRAVDRGQGAVGVLAEITAGEILLAGRDQQVEGEPLLLEAHHKMPRA